MGKINSWSFRVSAATGLYLAVSFLPGLAYADEPSIVSSVPTGALDEIVVTALKRDQNILEVPDQVAVFTSEEIERQHITRPGDYLSQVPNVTFYTSNTAGESFINIRGQTSVRNSESSAAVVIDGVQLPDADEFNGEVFDLQQVEVLKGPQGALYGRNASSGAVIITTRQPTDEYEGSATVGYGNFDSSRAVASVSGPIIPGELRFRVAGSVTNTDGPYQDYNNGEYPMRKSEGIGRVLIDWLPFDGLSVDLRLNGSTVRAGGIQFNAQEAPPLTAPVCGVVSPSINANSTDIPFCTNITSFDEQTKFNTSIKVDWRTFLGDVTSVSAYNEIRENYGGDNFPYVPDSGQPGALTQHYRTDNYAFSQELRLASKANKVFSWMVGAYYLTESKRFTQIQGEDLQGAVLPGFGPAGLGTVNPTTQFFDDKYGTTDYAIFANAQTRPIESFEIGLAARYDIEKRTIEDVAPATINPITAAPYSAFSGDRAQRTFDALTPKVTLTYFIVDQASIYASYGKGFKSGGFNPFGTRAALIDAALATGGSASQVFVQDSYNKETSETTEVGFKTRWLENKLSVEGALFKTNVDGSQQFEFFPSAGLQAISEIDKVSIKGWELSARATLLPGLQASAGYGAIHNRIAAFAADPAYVGNTAPYAAKNNASAALDYSREITTALAFNAEMDVQRTGQIQYILDNYPGSARDPVTLLNGRLAIQHDKLEVALWGKNLTDKSYNADVVPLLPFLQAVFKAYPRSYGAEVKYKF